MSETQQFLFIYKNDYLGLHVSTLTESSSGPLRYRSKISFVHKALQDHQRSCFGDPAMRYGHN